MKRWDEKRYHSLDYELKHQYGEKLYKITLNAGMTCPNRDGTAGDRGCIFCSTKGSGDFAGDAHLPIPVQISLGKKAIAAKRPVDSYIAYFQAFTNTYAPVEFLEQIYMEAITDPDIKVLSIATRPDCLGSEVLELLSRVQKIKPVWIELGLQTIHPDTAVYIRRGYELAVFEQALQNLHNLNIPVIVHTILCLPGETPQMMGDTIRYLNKNNIQGIKLQLLHILEDTDLALDYHRNPFPVPTMDEYIRLLGNCIALLKPETVIHRLTGDGPKDLLVAPHWSSSKRTILNQLNRYLKEHDIWQGKEYYDRNTDTL